MFRRLLYLGLTEDVTRSALLWTPISQLGPFSDIRPMVVCLCFALSACTEAEFGSPVTSGGGSSPEFRWCSHLETNQSALFLGEKCPDGWPPGSINECTNITSKKVELKLNPGPDQCPDGYSGGKVHDLCGDFSGFVIGGPKPCL